MISVVGLGAGGHAKVVIEILRHSDVEIVGLLDSRSELHGTKLLDVPVLGDDSLLSQLRVDGVSHAFIGVGTVGNIGPRLRVFQMARTAGFEIISAIHPGAVISLSAKLGIGPTIMAGAVVNAAAVINDDVIVNTGAIVEHDCRIGHHVHISPGATLGGGVSVGARSMVGLGAVVLPGIHVGSDVLIGAGAVVTRDVPDSKVVYGNPARVIRNHNSPAD
jgi:sugar O-acyltransferase (sialic acid O-acetyltransferase NeuD family)